MGNFGPIKSFCLRQHGNQTFDLKVKTEPTGQTHDLLSLSTDIEEL